MLQIFLSFYTFISYNLSRKSLVDRLLSFTTAAFLSHVNNQDVVLGTAIKSFRFYWFGSLKIKVVCMWPTMWNEFNFPGLVRLL